MTYERDKITRPAEDSAEDLARGYTDEDLAEVSEDLELTPEQIAAARPFVEVFPELAAAVIRRRGRQRAPTKVVVSMRLSRDVVDHFRATGRGWQARIEEILRKAAGL